MTTRTTKPKPAVKKPVSAKPTNKVVRPPSVSFTNSDVIWPTKSMFLYGGPGSGKTHFIGTISLEDDMKPMLVVDNDGGSLTLSSHPDFKGIQIINMHSFEPYETFMQWLLGDTKRPGVKDFTTHLGDPKQYKTIAIENIGKWHRYIRTYIKENVDFNRQHKDISSLQDYALAMEIVSDYLNALSKFAMYNEAAIILTAHYTLTTDNHDKNRIISRDPAIPGQLKQGIPGDMPLVGFFEVTAQKERAKPGQKSIGMKGGITTTYTANFEPFDRITQVKNRYHKIIPPMVDPSYQKLLPYLT